MFELNIVTERLNVSLKFDEVFVWTCIEVFVFIATHFDGWW